MQTHKEIIDQIELVLNQCKRESIISAFVGSLSTRNLPARSAFGSFLILKNFISHDFIKSEYFSGDCCGVCGLKSGNNSAFSAEDVANYPYQIQHTNIAYALFDLQTFDSRAVSLPSDEDVKILHAIMDSIRSLKPDAQLTQLIAALQGKLKSTKHERMILLETFGYAGILKPSGHFSYKDKYLSYDYVNITQPTGFNKKEWAYPVRFWEGSDGVDEGNLDFYFKEYLERSR